MTLRRLPEDFVGKALLVFALMDRGQVARAQAAASGHWSVADSDTLRLVSWQNSPLPSLSDIEAWLMKTSTDNPVTGLKYGPWALPDIGKTSDQEGTRTLWVGAPVFDDGVVQIHYTEELWRTKTSALPHGNEQTSSQVDTYRYSITFPLNAISLDSVREALIDASDQSLCSETHICAIAEPGLYIGTVGDKIKIATDTTWSRQHTSTEFRPYNEGPNQYDTNTIAHVIFIPTRSLDLARRMANAWRDAARLSGAKDVKPNLY